LISIRFFALAAVFMPTVGIVGAQSSPVSQNKQPANVPKPQVSVTISSPNVATKIGSPILVKVTITNISDHDMIVPALPLEDLRSQFRIEVRDSQGNEVSLRKPLHPSTMPPKPEDLPMGGQRGIFLPPGGSSVFDVDLLQIFNLNQPGNYTVQAKHFNGPDKSWVKSNTISLTVTS